MAFAFLGLVSAVVQGGLIRRLVPRFGEPRLIVAGIATLVVGFVALTLSSRAGRRCWPPRSSWGSARAWPAPRSPACSRATTPEGEQGAVFGTLSSAQTLARMINYSVANLLLARVGPSAPYWEAAAVAAVALLLASRLLGRRDPMDVDPPAGRERGDAGRGGVTSALNPRGGAGQAAIEVAADRLGVGVGEPGQHGPHGVGAGDHDLDRLDQGLGPGGEEPLGEEAAGRPGRSNAASIALSRRASRCSPIGRRPATRPAPPRGGRPGSVRAQSSRSSLTSGGGTGSSPSPQNRPSHGA